MVIITAHNYTLVFPVNSCQLLQPSAVVVSVQLPDILNVSQCGTEISFYKTSTVEQILNRTTGSTNVFYSINTQTAATTFTIGALKYYCKFLSVQTTTAGVYAWAQIQ
jgi:hypothetical protein